MRPAPVIDGEAPPAQGHIDQLSFPGRHTFLSGIPVAFICLPYSGWVQFSFSSGDGDKKRARTRLNVYYHHGSGGGGPVTRGTIGTNRRSAILSNVHAVLTGHIHESWVVWVPQVAISDYGKVYRFEQLHLQSSTYKREFDEYEDYHTERGRGPKPIGGSWLTFWYENSVRGRIRYDGGGI